MSTQSSIVTLGELKKRVLEKADMVDSPFIDDTDGDSELVRVIQQSYRSLYNVIATTYKDYFIGDPVTFSIASGASTFTLDATFLKLAGVDRDLGGGQWRKIRAFNFAERNNQNDRLYRNYYPVIRYRIIGNRLMFTPAEQAAGDYRYWFTPKPIVPIDEDDTIEGYNGWDDFIVVDAAIKCLVKEESDVSVLLMERNQLRQDIIENAMIRDESEVDVIQDVNRDTDDFDEFY